MLNFPMKIVGNFTHPFSDIPFCFRKKTKRDHKEAGLNFRLFFQGNAIILLVLMFWWYKSNSLFVVAYSIDLVSLRSITSNSSKLILTVVRRAAGLFFTSMSSISSVSFNSSRRRSDLLSILFSFG